METNGKKATVGKNTRQRAQADHADVGGAHGGQHSGGMGGEHGGDLHDIGTGQSGMTGRGGMGGNETGDSRPTPAQQGNGETVANAQEAASGEDISSSDDELVEPVQGAELQQSEQREGFGHHRHDR
jgi:hypothetical protein